METARPMSLTPSQTMASGAASSEPETDLWSVQSDASLQETQPRALKQGDAFAVFDHHGDALSGPRSPEGLFWRDTRHLSHLAMTVCGRRPMLLSSILRDDNATLTCDLTNPDVFDQDGELRMARDALHIRRSCFLWNAACHQRVVVKNYDQKPHRVMIAITFSADFADLFEVRGSRREHRGERHPPEPAANHVRLSYTGLDQRVRVTTLGFDPEPSQLTGNRAVFEFTLAPRESRTLYMEVSCRTPGVNRSPAQGYFTALRDSRRDLRRLSGRAAAVSSSNDVFNEALRRSVSDLYMLVTDTEDGPYPYAGIPWFSTVFGRDALITALQTLWLDPEITRGVLRHLARNQATETDALADAEPGKILHEIRHGEMAELREVPFRRYYGSVDSTPLFVALCGAYLRRTGDVRAIQQLWPHVVAALDWIRTSGDRDGDGFVEYGRQTPDGLVNQGWKDSFDSVFHANGALAPGPIALCEVQAYVYAAWQAARDMAAALGDGATAAACETRARDLRTAFDAAFFDEELGTYVLALDGDKRPCRVRASNAGHVLTFGLALPERAVAVAKTLMAPGSFCGWGVRTVPETEARYNPMSYHNGSVWPHDNALVAYGLRRYGYRAEAGQIFAGLFAASTYIEMRRLPELFCGFARQRGQGPTFYPVACSPQAWAATAPLFMLQACLGVSFDPAGNAISFTEPLLPPFLDEVTIRNLRIGEASCDIAVSGRQSIVHVLRRSGPLKVLVTA